MTWGAVWGAAFGGGSVSCPALQMSSGFTRLLGAADDLVLDIPDAVHLLSLFLGR